MTDELVVFLLYTKNWRKLFLFWSFLTTEIIKCKHIDYLAQKQLLAALRKKKGQKKNLLLKAFTSRTKWQHKKEKIVWMLYLNVCINVRLCVCLCVGSSQWKMTHWHFRCGVDAWKAAHHEQHQHHWAIQYWPDKIITLFPLRLKPHTTWPLRNMDRTCKIVKGQVNAINYFLTVIAMQESLTYPHSLSPCNVMGLNDSFVWVFACSCPPDDI